MSFDRTLNPNAQTHVPVKVEIPADDDVVQERPYIHPPTLWAEGVKVRHKATGREAVVRRVALDTEQFRAWYPDTGENDSRTTWQSFRDWDPVVELSPAEREREAARHALEAEIASLPENELALVQVLIDDPDPARARAKFDAMKKAGLIGRKK